MNILDYKEMNVKLLWITPDFRQILKLACDTTMKNFPEFGTEISPALIKYLIEADHTKVLEHVCMGIQVTGMSRSLLQQNITHRTWSCTSSSQHYQDYRQMPLVLSKDWWGVDYDVFADTLQGYGDNIDSGMPKEEARQCLPGACAVNQVITTNFRNLINFFSLRLCQRNVQEMQIFATKLYKLCYMLFPEFVAAVGPQCYLGTCRQGKMMCSNPPWESPC